MRYTVKKTFAAAAATGNALLVRVKDNQPRLLESLAGLCAVQPPTDHLDTIDHHAHGREEHRRVEVFAAERLDPDWRAFVACIVRVTRRTWCRGPRPGPWRAAGGGGHSRAAPGAGTPAPACGGSGVRSPTTPARCRSRPELAPLPCAGTGGSRTATTTCVTAPWARMPAASGTSPVSSPAYAPSRSTSCAPTASAT